MSYVLREWSVMEDQSNPYAAPETRRRGLAGKVYGNPNFDDGTFVITSSVIESNGRTCKTKSGSTYILEGDPAEAYVQFLNENKIPLDLENPIRVIK